MEKYNRTNEVLVPAIYNFINSSKTDCITADKVKQFMNDCDIALNQQSIKSKRWIDIFVDVFTYYRNAYLSITMNHDTYILKFDNASTLELFSKTSLLSPIASFSALKNCNDIFDYDKHELEIIQDDYAYEIITSCNIKNNYTIVVVDAKSRMVMFYIYKDNLMKNIVMPKYVAINRFNLSTNKKSIHIEDLSENIRNAVIAQITLISLT